MIWPDSILQSLAPYRCAEASPIRSVNGGHGELLGESLAGLHRSMRELPTVDLPRVVVLEIDTSGRWDSTASDQLLHGDFAVSNLIEAPDGIRILDFDDRGYGPVEFDIANSLYMVMFDSWVNDRSHARYQEFGAAFVGGYARFAGQAPDDGTIDSMIGVRVAGLGRWAADPSQAPIGIRNSRPEWIDTLNRFVRAWLDRPMWPAHDRPGVSRRRRCGDAAGVDGSICGSGDGLQPTEAAEVGGPSCESGPGS